ncbi:AMP-binding protein [Roseateles koreensis]|uniref:Long-chain-fatty-acid--CoA ligase n=1 Tax=Roseateles koreensis TaxID=2987526 RepID=A0ABT5KN57_9BURK|nr:AMP-binding protein [Roseateles koreensis]MDC8784272.1 AMP-binding protein [Roseateles koreensis]
MNARHWTRSYGTIPLEINPDRYPSVTAMMDEAMVQYADQVAFNCFGKTLTYAQVDQLSAAFCAYLQHTVGIKKGDRVAVMLPNLAAFPLALLGIIRAGAVQVNVNPLYTPRELEHQLTDAGCDAIVIFTGSTPTLGEIIGKTHLKSVLTVGLGDGLGAQLPSPAVDARLTQAVPFTTALAEGAKLERVPVSLTGADTLFLQYTGGTTGLSKGATLSHRNLVANTEQFKAFMAGAMRPAEEVVVTAVPLYHIMALMGNFLSYFSIGAENWLVANPRDMDGFVATLKAARPSVFVGVNTLYQGLTLHPGLKEVDWSRLRLSAGGGAAVVGVTSDRWKAITGNFIREGYGLSETSPILSFNPLSIDDFSGSTGLPAPSTDVKLLDDDGHEVALGEAGEVCAKGPQVMSGYWRKPEANVDAFTPDGYFKTGDVGVFDERGFLKIVDRKKDMILVSGFNVYPNDVEAVASACPGVAECACIGVPDDKTGEAVMLYIVKTPEATLTAEEVRAYCRRELTAYKVPKQVAFLASLPKSAVGKILRRDLRTAA